MNSHISTGKLLKINLVVWGEWGLFVRKRTQTNNQTNPDTSQTYPSKIGVIRLIYQTYKRVSYKRKRKDNEITFINIYISCFNIHIWTDKLFFNFHRTLRNEKNKDG